jgi:NAD(P)-dependent dehydrogenase (short-subunit alcohol dehydrogenase family)
METSTKEYLMGTIAVVTGSSSGIGKAIYDHLARSGRRVVGVAWEGPDIPWNLASKDSIPALVHKIRDKGRVAILINAAGVWTPLDPRFTFEVNFWAPTLLVHELVASGTMERGVVINIASTAAHMAEVSNPIYAASKAALVSITKSYARMLAPSIRVVSISPGLFRTQMFDDPAPESLLHKVPMGYEARPDAILAAVECVLASEYMTGCDILVDGGLSLGAR